MAALTTAQIEAIRSYMERGYAFDSASTQRKLIEEGYLTKDGKPTRKATDYADQLATKMRNMSWQDMTPGEIIYTLTHNDGITVAKDYVSHGAPHLTKEVYGKCWSLKDEDVKEGMDVVTARKFVPYYDSLTDYPKVLLAPDAIIDTMATFSHGRVNDPGRLGGFTDYLKGMDPDVITQAMSLAASRMDFLDYSRFYTLLDEDRQTSLYEDETQPVTLRVAMGNVLGDDSLFCEENDFTMVRHYMNLLSLDYTDRMLNHILDMMKHGELPAVPFTSVEGLSQGTVRRIMASDSPAVAAVRYSIEEAAETLKSCRESIRRILSRYDIPENVLAETGEE
ncbi:hypothetical protein A200_07784 [Parascardovia denticolens IPLA 20019]|uniref:hypothetical protein n=1 Tax=Parascardovia denticolens TaxID=78258 RepID=UPI0002669E48|nr:hypothetical protein [Parascardovia denticolens]EIT87565.1 hypothetical protein A200_07784 [Parascardovia denticolens IPLA 20019]